MNKMTDRELLELAAKAAGLGRLLWWKDQNCYQLIDQDGPPRWNPLTDDGDALRLATSLYMLVNHGPCQASASTIEGTPRGFQAYECTISQDHGKAVRRAIVRAAAEIGSQMK